MCVCVCVYLIRGTFIAPRRALRVFSAFVRLLYLSRIGWVTYTYRAIKQRNKNNIQNRMKKEKNSPSVCLVFEQRGRWDLSDNIAAFFRLDFCDSNIHSTFMVYLRLLFKYILSSTTFGLFSVSLSDCVCFMFVQCINEWKCDKPIFDKSIRISLAWRQTYGQFMTTSYANTGKY